MSACNVHGESKNQGNIYSTNLEDRSYVTIGRSENMFPRGVTIFTLIPDNW